MWEGPCNSQWGHWLTGGPGWYKKGGWAGHGEQASKQPSSAVFASGPASRWLHEFPSLTSFHGVLML